MRRFASVMSLFAWAACASSGGRVDHLPERDFSVPDDLAAADDFAVAVSDLSTPPPDGGAADAPLLTDAGNQGADLAAADLAQPLLGCGDGGTSGHLFLAGVGPNNALYSTYFDGAAWNSFQVASLPKVAETALSLVDSRPALIARLSDGKLAYSAINPCSGVFPALAQISSHVTALRPAATGGTLSTDDVVFRGAVGGNAAHVFHLHRAGDIWSTAFEQTNLSVLDDGASGAHLALVRFGGALHVLYAEDITKNLQDGTVVDSAGGGASAQIGTAKASQPPVAVVDGAGTLHVVWAEADTNLNWAQRTSDGGGAWSAPQQLCFNQTGCIINSKLPPALAVDAAGQLVAAWSGEDKNVYVSHLAGTQWGPAELASGSCGTGDCHSTLGPALTTGLGPALVELVFVRDSDGLLTHMRGLPADMATSWTFAATLPVINFLNTPALVTER